MYAVSRTPKGKTEDGKQIVDAFILADSDPDTLPTTGAGIEGLSADDVFAPFSMLYALPDKVYVANESGVFTPTST